MPVVKMLVIEDQEPLRGQVIEILQLEGFEAVGADDGVIGAQKAREYLPDLIICDVMMPRLDGYGVLLELQNNPATVAIPLFFGMCSEGWQRAVLMK
jgi:DNA-binding response OmpR family regulator